MTRLRDRARSAFVAAIGAFSLAAGSASCHTKTELLGCRSADCGPHGTCIAGRCQLAASTSASGSAAAKIPAIDAPGVKRIVIAASEIAFVREGSTRGDVPPVIHLGRAADGDSMLLARFPVGPGHDGAHARLHDLGHVVEAYLLLPRPANADDDPGNFSLHAARISSGWSARSTTWSNRPSVDDLGAPRTRVRSELGALNRLVRVDVKIIVDRVRATEDDRERDVSIAVVADDRTVSGLSLATPMSDDASSLPAGALPALELYVAPD